MKRTAFGCIPIAAVILIFILFPTWRVLTFRLGILVAVLMMGILLMVSGIHEIREDKPANTEGPPVYKDRDAYDKIWEMNMRHGNLNYPSWEEYQQKKNQSEENNTYIHYPE
jgi:hypothetical protein